MTELSDADVDKLLERFDQTDPSLQRRIIAAFVQRAAITDSRADAWRKACRFIYDVAGEVGPKGRPCDCWDRRTRDRIAELIGAAEELEVQAVRVA